MVATLPAAGSEEPDIQLEPHHNRSPRERCCEPLRTSRPTVGRLFAPRTNAGQVSGQPWPALVAACRCLALPVCPNEAHSLTLFSRGNEFNAGSLKGAFHRRKGTHFRVDLLAFQPIDRVYGHNRFVRQLLLRPSQQSSRRSDLCSSDHSGHQTGWATINATIRCLFYLIRCYNHLHLSPISVRPLECPHSPIFAAQHAAAFNPLRPMRFER